MFTIRSFAHSAIVLGGLLASVAGCGKAEPAAKSARVSAPRSERPQVNEATADQIAKAGNPLPPLDKGRLQLSGPKGWVAAPRDKKFVAQFLPRPGAAYPRIMVTAEPAPGTDDLTAKNVAAFAKILRTAQDIAAEDGDSASLQAPTPLKVGDRYWVESIRRAHTKSTPLERLLLVTVAGGRKYTLELRAYVGLIAAHRPETLAVAASLQTTATDADQSAVATDGAE